MEGLPAIHLWDLVIDTFSPIGANAPTSKRPREATLFSRQEPHTLLARLTSKKHFSPVPSEDTVSIPSSSIDWVPCILENTSRRSRLVVYYAEAIDKIYGEVAPTDASTLAMILKEPIGVVGAIVPWNFPLMISAWKIAPALAMGNSVVLKPSEIASLSALRLVELAHEAGLPDGVLNVVTGQGAVAPPII